jgi:hypothetical protein
VILPAGQQGFLSHRHGHCSACYCP